MSTNRRAASRDGSRRGPSGPVDRTRRGSRSDQRSTSVGLVRSRIFSWTGLWRSVNGLGSVRFRSRRLTRGARGRCTCGFRANVAMPGGCESWFGASSGPACAQHSSTHEHLQFRWRETCAKQHRCRSHETPRPMHAVLRAGAVSVSDPWPRASSSDWPRTAAVGDEPSSASRCAPDGTPVRASRPPRRAASALRNEHIVPIGDGTSVEISGASESRLRRSLRPDDH